MRKRKKCVINMDPMWTCSRTVSPQILVLNFKHCFGFYSVFVINLQVFHRDMRNVIILVNFSVYLQSLAAEDNIRQKTNISSRDAERGEQREMEHIKVVFLLRFGLVTSSPTRCKAPCL